MFQYYKKVFFFVFAGLVEQKEELQAQLLSNGLDQGRELLNDSALGEASLAMELEELTSDEVKLVSWRALAQHLFIFWSSSVQHRRFVRVPVCFSPVTLPELPNNKNASLASCNRFLVGANHRFCRRFFFFPFFFFFF